jgi:hypothetical protein
MQPSGTTRAGAGNLPAHGRYGELTLLHVLVFTCVLAFLFLLDITTTEAILGMGGVELNPLMAGVVAFPLLHVIIKCGILLLVIPIALIAESKVRGSGVALYAILIGMYAAVTLNNVTVLLPHILKVFTG